MQNSRIKQTLYQKFWLMPLMFTLCLLMACAPVIDSFTPERGNPGTRVTIEGKRLGKTPSDTQVRFAGVTATNVEVVTENEKLIATVPPGALTGLISVTVDSRTGESDHNFIIDGVAANWTFMVYLDSDNNLEGAGIDDFLEMASVGSSANLNIVVQMDRIPGHTSSHGDWTTTRRFLVQNGDNPGITPLADLGEQNMGDPAVLQSFVQWAVTNYPADHYALSIWNHGDGWRMQRERLNTTTMRDLGRGNSDEAVSRAVASDDTDNDVLFMKEVQTALEAAKPMIKDRHGTNVKIDVIGFDACLMGLVEVGYAMRNSANYVVASEELEPGDGWPYDTILDDINNTPTFSARDVAGIIVTNYGAAYTSGVTQASGDIAKLNTLCTRINEFANAMNTEWAAIETARNNSMDYHVSGFATTWGVDLWDFADHVYNEVSSSQIKNAAQAVKQAVDDFITNEHHSSNRTGSHGIAIYFPPTQAQFTADPDHYGYLESNSFMPVDFVNDHRWDNWLQTFYTNAP